MKTEQFNRPVLHKRYFCNSQPGHNEDGVAEMPMVRCKPAAGRLNYSLVKEHMEDFWTLTDEKHPSTW